VYTLQHSRFNQHWPPVPSARAVLLGERAHVVQGRRRAAPPSHRAGAPLLTAQPRPSDSEPRAASRRLPVTRRSCEEKLQGLGRAGEPARAAPATRVADQARGYPCRPLAAAARSRARPIRAPAGRRTRGGGGCGPEGGGPRPGALRPGSKRRASGDGPPSLPPSRAGGGRPDAGGPASVGSVGAVPRRRLVDVDHAHRLPVLLPQLLHRPAGAAAAARPGLRPPKKRPRGPAQPPAEQARSCPEGRRPAARPP
jgi:hypothetical protein